MALEKTEAPYSRTGISADNPFSGKRVLIVDDSPLQRRKLRDLYESMGFTCIGEAGNGVEALNLIAKTRPHLISLDILMPEMNGVETLGYLRAKHYNGFIVFVTALGGADVVGEARSRGGHQADFIFSKSDTRDVFMETLFALFSRAEQHQTA